MKTDMCGLPYTKKNGSFPWFEFSQTIKLASDHMQQSLVISWKQYHLNRASKPKPRKTSMKIIIKI